VRGKTVNDFHTSKTDSIVSLLTAEIKEIDIINESQKEEIESYNDKFIY